MSSRKRLQRDRATPTRCDEPEIYKRARTTAFIIAELIGYERKVSTKGLKATFFFNFPFLQIMLLHLITHLS